MLLKVGINILAYKSKEVSRLNLIIILACLNLNNKRVDLPFIYIYKLYKFIII